MSAILGSRQFWDAVFGWKITPAEVVIADPVPAPRLGLQASLEKILGGSLDQIGRDAEVSLAHGVSVGGVEEIRNAAGLVVNYRPKHYASPVEAGVAGKIAHLEMIDADPEIIAEARRLAPLASRYALRTRLRALDDLEPARSSLQPRERPAFEPEATPNEAPSSLLSLADQNRVALHQRRKAIEQDARDLARAKHDRRNSLESLAGRLPPDPNDATAERVSIIVKLAEWNARFPELAAELAACGDV